MVKEPPVRHDMVKEPPVRKYRQSTKVLSHLRHITVMPEGAIEGQHKEEKDRAPVNHNGSPIWNKETYHPLRKFKEMTMKEERTRKCVKASLVLPDPVRREIVEYLYLLPLPIHNGWGRQPHIEAYIRRYE